LVRSSALTVAMIGSSKIAFHRLDLRLKRHRQLLFKRRDAFYSILINSDEEFLTSILVRRYYFKGGKRRIQARRRDNRPIREKFYRAPTMVCTKSVLEELKTCGVTYVVGLADNSSAALIALLANNSVLGLR
jgi:hypothetical protein